MSVFSGPRIINPSSGLLLELDAANIKSYSGSGSAWNDLSGNGNNSTLKNTVFFSNTSSGYLTFNGTDSYAQVSTNVADNLAAMTVAAWIRCNLVIPTDGTIVAKAPSLGLGWGFYLANINSTVSGERISFLSVDSLGAIIQRNATSTVTADNKWHYVVASCTSLKGSSSSVINLYQDGVLLPSADNGSSGNVVNISNAGTVTIGSDYDNVYPLPVSVALVQIYNRALSTDEILQNFNAQRGRFGI
jgi:hypothetical protein